MRNVKQDLANLSQKKVSDIRMSRLMKFSGAARKQRELEATYGTELNLNIPQVERVRNLVAQALEEEADEINGALPVISVFDALQHVKSQKDLQKDAGLRTLYGHLQRMWDNSLEERGPSDITAASFMTLKDHYARNYPKSKAANVIDGFGRKGYSSLNRSDLTRLASEIETQEDFERVVIENGLQGRAPNQVKARKFILACVNSQEEEVMRPFDRRAQVDLEEPNITVDASTEYWIDRCDEAQAEEAAMEAAGNWRDFESFGWDRSDEEGIENWTIVYTSSRDSELLDQANATVISEMMDQFPEDQVQPESHGHWAVGHVDGYSIKVYDQEGSLTPAFKAWCGLQQRLEEYPILDEDLYSEMEDDATIENIKNEGNSLTSEDAPEDWAYSVYRWLLDNDPSSIESADDQGGYPSEDDIKEALSTLGWLDEDEEDFDKESKKAQMDPDRKQRSLESLHEWLSPGAFDKSLKNIEESGSHLVDLEKAPRDWPLELLCELWDDFQEDLRVEVDGSLWTSDDTITYALESLGWLSNDIDEEEY